jgi:hypothetical protein
VGSRFHDRVPCSRSRSYREKFILPQNQLSLSNNDKKIWEICVRKNT